MRNIILGILFIVGGLSGQLVLRGTNSSGLLVVVGMGLFIMGLIQVARSDGGTPERPAVKVKVGDQAVVQQEAVVYTEMESRSTRVAKLVPGTKVEIVAVSDTNGVQWLSVKLPEGQQGYVLGYDFQ